MSRIPFPISDNWNDAKPQIEELVRILYEERVGGLLPSSTVIKDGDSIALPATEATEYEIYPDSYQENSSPGNTDMTQAFMDALSDVPAGGKIKLRPTTYRITEPLIISGNRITIEGYGLYSLLNFAPSAGSVSMWSTSGNKDNLVLRNFACTLTNPSSYQNVTCYTGSNDDNSTTFDRIYITSFNQYGILLQNSMYDRILGCRFINMDNSNDGSYLSQALRTTGYANNLIVRDSRFGQNDIAIAVNTAGHNVLIEGNSFELNGDSENAAGIVHTNIFEAVSGLVIRGNYFESNKTGTNYGVVRCTNCLSPLVESNIFAGKEGSTEYSDVFVHFDGAATRFPSVRLNWFEEVIHYFVKSTNAMVKLERNYYYDGGAEVTARAAILALTDDAGLMDLDVT